MSILAKVTEKISYKNSQKIYILSNHLISFPEKPYLISNNCKNNTGNSENYRKNG